MTKSIRIENADTSNHKILVEVWDKGINGQPDRLNHTANLDSPCQMDVETIHSGDYIIIKEIE